MDPELAQNGIDLVSRLFVKDPGVILQPQQRESLISFFSFTLDVLDGQEPLPKATAAEFWVSRAVKPSQAIRSLSGMFPLTRYRRSSCLSNRKTPSIRNS